MSKSFFITQLFYTLSLYKSKVSHVQTLSQQQRTSHIPAVRSQGHEPNGWKTWFGMMVLLSKVKMIQSVSALSKWYIMKQIQSEWPDPVVAGNTRACMTAWTSRDAWGAPPTQADTWRVSRTHSRLEQQSGFVPFSAHRDRLRFSLRWTRTTAWGTKENK